MLLKLSIVLTLTICIQCYIYSSFWAPLLNPRILNYRVDAAFNPMAGKNQRAQYTKNYGYRGEHLIADLGNGRELNTYNYKVLEKGVEFYYTFAGADDNVKQ